ncbi:radical SAM superfamily protein [Vibrio phage 2.117.O._10N.261.45.E9]|nr:radical SAM superfamily protein [Vibrio phage 1.117.O._10N.261.45.E9]AUR95460.1 radical SAM superfamily protein [Vibrio phage 1.207.B._10N.222.51.C2]AUS02351.1 radical SAM superfamily protein [Vibrio phage 2.117.O._10N.261.45.E9]
MKNHQPKEPLVTSTDILDLHSLFFTIQGEGIYSGCPAVFVRLAGCTLQCPFCDTEYTDNRKKVKPQYIVDQVYRAHSHINYNPVVVITGGEPLRQPIGELCDLLVGRGYKVQIETNGTAYQPCVPYDEISVICSPKMPHVHPKLRPHVTAYKYVLSADAVNDVDGLPNSALGLINPKPVARPPHDFKGPVYIHPMDAHNDIDNLRHQDAAVRSALRHGYTFGLQVHKLINME